MHLESLLLTLYRPRPPIAQALLRFIFLLRLRVKCQTAPYLQLNFCQLHRLHLQVKVQRIASATTRLLFVLLRELMMLASIEIKASVVGFMVVLRVLL